MQIWISLKDNEKTNYKFMILPCRQYFDHRGNQTMCKDCSTAQQPDNFIFVW